MVSEGVDIKRLRVLVYLPAARTELAFRQAIGRVVRTLGPDDDTRAYVVMPSFECMCFTHVALAIWRSVVVAAEAAQTAAQAEAFWARGVEAGGTSGPSCR